MDLLMGKPEEPVFLGGRRGLVAVVAVAVVVVETVEGATVLLLVLPASLLDLTRRSRGRDADDSPGALLLLFCNCSFGAEIESRARTAPFGVSVGCC